MVRRAHGLLALTLLVAVPLQVHASHCEEFSSPYGIAFALCDADSDGVADTVRFASTLTGSRGDLTAYHETYGDTGKLRAHYVFVPGGPGGPALHGDVTGNDHGQNLNYDDMRVRGGASSGMPGAPRASYFLTTTDPNDNRNPNTIDLMLCSTETGCQELV